MNILTHATGVLNSFSSSEAAASLAVILGISLRALPTDQPMCILLAAGDIVQGLADFLKSVSVALNKVLPQNIKK